MRPDSAAGPRLPGASGDASPVPSGVRPLAITGTIAACAAAGIGIAVLTMLVLVGWIAAPHAGPGLTGVLRTAALLWLIGHHVGFTLPGVGRIGMLPLGLVLLPGALLWRAGRWVARAGGVCKLGHVGYAALALAVPYAMVAAALALASSSARAAPSLPEAVVCSFLLALTAGGLGGARGIAPWTELAGLLPARLRSLTAGTAAALAVLTAAGGLLAGASLAAHLDQFREVNESLAPGAVGGVLLLLAQLAYVPNVMAWAISFTLGPGFAFGTGTVIAPTGSALGQLPAFPLLAALPQGAHSAVPPLLSVAVLAVPYLAGVFGGLLTVRAAPILALETAPLWGFACGALTGGVIGVMAAFAGGPLGNGRLTAVGPSAWQVGVVAALDVGVAAAVTAGVANWLRLRTAAGPPAEEREVAGSEALPAFAVMRVPGQGPDHEPDDDGHTIYLDPWTAGADPNASGAPPTSPSPFTASPGPSSLP
ncbi:MAG TPA: DUF6350 family protein [Streptosporangiaceae bacterium]|nr:DUF6350 family protein [Streptosporangiaceae bacterium]